MLSAPDVARAADLARACLREPRRVTRLLDAEEDAHVRDGVEVFVRRLRDAPGRLGTAGQDELVSRLTEMFAGEG